MEIQFRDVISQTVPVFIAWFVISRKEKITNGLMLVFFVILLNFVWKRVMVSSLKYDFMKMLQSTFFNTSNNSIDLKRKSDPIYLTKSGDGVKSEDESEHTHDTERKNDINLFPKAWEETSLMEDEFQTFAPNKKKWEESRSQDVSNMINVVMDGDPKRKKLGYQGIHHYVNAPEIRYKSGDSDIMWGDSEFRYM